MIGGLLQRLMSEDGITLRGSEDEKACICPFHEDTDPSMSVNTITGLYQCHGCGAKGDAVTYLHEKRGLTLPEAIAQATGNTGNQADVKPKRTPKHPTKVQKPANRQKTALSAISDNPPKQAKPMPLPDCEQRHDYLDRDGVLRFTVLRRGAGKGRWIRPFTPAADGLFTAQLAMASNRPLYRLHALIAAPPAAQVMIVEGEGCADKAAAAFAEHGVVVVSWAGGTKAWAKTDWRPIKGRSVVLVADDDHGSKPNTGHEAMRAIASHLHGLGTTALRIALPMNSPRSGWDIADELEQGGSERGAAWIKRHVQPFTPSPTAQPQPQPSPPPDDSEPPDDIDGRKTLAERMSEKRPFIILGTAGADKAVLQTARHHVLIRSFENLQTSRALIAIAPRKWWVRVAGGNLTSEKSQACGDILIREAESKGEVALDRFIGRGAIQIRGETIYHLGDRLLVGGQECDLAPRGGWIFLPRVRIPLAEQRATPELKAEFAEAIMGYKWATPDDGKRWLGWLVSAIVGGALEWRPHLWFCDDADSGKSWIIKNSARPLFEPFYISGADTTPASTARRIASDALPVVFEEAEPDESYISELLPIVRIASGEDGERQRSNQSGGVTIERPRFCAAVMSTKLPRLNAASRSRFAWINLQKTRFNITEWGALEKRIKAATTADKMDAIRAAIIHDAGDIAAHAKEAAQQIAGQADMSMRAAMIGGALTAGYEYLTSDESGIKWSVQPSTYETDAINALRMILDTTIRYRDSALNQTMEASIGKFLRMTWHLESEQEPVRDIGIFYRKGEGLIIAHRHTALERLLRSTALQKVDVGSLLRSINGARATKHAVRFGGVRHRAIVIPDEVLETVGLDLENSLIV